MDIFGIIGTTTGIIAIAALIWRDGAWRSEVKTKVKTLCDEHEKYPLAETHTMVKTLWDVYVLGALGTRPDLAQHHSPLFLTETAQRLIPEPIKDALCKIPRNPQAASGWLVIKSLGMSVIEELAKEKSLSVQEAIGILSLYLEAHADNCKPIRTTTEDKEGS